MQAWLEAHCEDPLVTALHLAQAFQVSLRQVHIVFSQDPIHGSFLRTLQSIRMKRANHLLTDPLFKHVPVKQLATRCGYSDPGSFRKIFKRHFGAPPAMYTRQQ